MTVEQDPDRGIPRSRSLRWPILAERLRQAFANLYQASAVGGRGDGDSLWITDEGRRLTENDVQELAIGDAEAPEEPAR